MKTQFALIIAFCLSMPDAWAQGNEVTARENDNVLSFRSEWPASLQRQATLKYCSDLLSSSVNSSNLMLFSVQLTNLPQVIHRAIMIDQVARGTYDITNNDVMLHFKDFTDWLESKLKTYAQALLKPDIDAFVVQESQYCAIITNVLAKSEIVVLFRNKSGPISQIQESDSSKRGMRSSVEFYQNGRIKTANRGHEVMTFKENGELDDYFCNLYPHIAITLQQDNKGAPKILSYFSTNSPAAQKQ